jgi:hypothetical protein
VTLTHSMTSRAIRNLHFPSERPRCFSQDATKLASS